LPAFAGKKVGWLKIFWIPASAGMTVFFAKNSPTHQLEDNLLYGVSRCWSSDPHARLKGAFSGGYVAKSDVQGFVPKSVFTVGG
jgi:hypothetical protein